MRRRLQKDNPDSLELLLDTLCNVFGGIILIACLLAMLNRPKPTKDPASQSSDREAGILLEKKIEMARAELDGLQKRRSALQRENDPVLLPMVQELQALRRTAEVKRQTIAQQDDLAAKKAEELMRDTSAEIARLREQALVAEKKLGLVNKDTEAARQRHSALKKQLADIQLELENIADLDIEKIRFPKERQMDRPPSPIIIRYGQIFPVYDAQGKPAQGVAHLRTPDGQFTALPTEGAGLMPVSDAKRLRTFLPEYVGRNGYLTLYVYPDSFGIMRELKQLIFKLGLDYGMDICEEHRVLVFSAQGAKPKPL
jgi:hypothetical protein